MQILITGSSGQLGKTLQTQLSDHVLALVDLPKVDITKRKQVFNKVDSFRPELIIHCAAYTDVDGCVHNPNLAYLVNGLGTQNVALACERVGAEMVHISSNEVFAGDRRQGYEEWMPLSPLNVYGRSKAAGEIHVRNILRRFYIVRTAWLYAPGGRNFIHSILQKSQQIGQLRVVVDEIGNPTYSADLANAIAGLIETHQYGTYHLVNEGACSRFDFAMEILRLGGVRGTNVSPILSSQYARASTPPPFAALNNIAGAAIGITLRPWQEALAAYVDQHLRPLGNTSN